MVSVGMSFLGGPGGMGDGRRSAVGSERLGMAASGRRRGSGEMGGDKPPVLD
jgi:hypothetical protein